MSLSSAMERVMRILQQAGGWVDIKTFKISVNTTRVLQERGLITHRRRNGRIEVRATGTGMQWPLP